MQGFKGFVLATLLWTSALVDARPKHKEQKPIVRKEW